MGSSKTKTEIKPEAGRILIADDEEIAHLTLKRLLEPQGYTIDSAYSGKEALAKIDTGYDLLILDVRMPDMDGIEVLREIRKRQLDIEVVILTGYATLESATQALSYGARTYVMKPIENIPEFKSNIRETMHVSQLARDNRQLYDAIISGRVDSLQIGGKLLEAPITREENKEIFQRLMEVIRDGVVFLDFDGNITFANVNFAKMLSESYQKLLGARFESYVAQEYHDKIIEVFTRLTSGEVAVSIPAQLKTSYGRIISVIISSSPIYYQMEYRGIAMVISDITEMNKVREKVELMANLVENAQHDMMFIAHSEGQIMECNSLARSSFGYSQSQMLGLNIGVLFKSSGDKRWEEIMDSVKLGLSWRGEIMGATKDGKEFPVEITVSKPPSKVDSDGSIICFVRDLTERKRLEEERSKLERMKTEFLSNVSHELRTPLQSIKGFTKLMLQGKVPDPETQKEFLAIIDRQSENLSTLIESLLDMSRIESCHFDINIAPMSLRDLIQGVVHEYDSMANGKNIALTEEIPAALPEIEADEERLRQVIVNLLGNAI
ncbi:MAG: PAS domain S-box protein, partial [Dehalococcoidia bacterium]|nr:PAS domain S-box protein [Dehalococcoidia bacterium]